ncbi:hypothetical protein [Streptomyces sp. SID8352]|uniref:SCO0607 family lipoprotein n=1 Tax=Streptomyces sp. SID8352 TaxID=2690338 RepID=UPI00136F6642|nr:hypothetical protein [Streptomyces sp. SID8352]MYU24676.1 hypothetical protein [Streptomyces sp. SID8352]
MRSPRGTNRPRTATALRPRRTRLLTAALVCAAGAVTVTGCAGLEYREASCAGGEYPVVALGGTGSACVPDGEAPPDGFRAYPRGKVPKYVDDEWDVYWRTHVVDRDGTISDAPDEG